MPKPEHPIASRWHLPPLASYQGRYFYLALVLIIVLLSVAWLGYRQVIHTTQAHIQRAETRNQTEFQVNQVLMSLQAVENWLGNQVMQPGIRQKTDLQTRFAQLEYALALLQTYSHWLGPEENEKIRRLNQTDFPYLLEHSRDFLRISHQNNLRFPSSEIMQKHLRPLADRIRDQLNDLIFQLSLQENHLRLFTRVFDIRYNWQQTLAEFRLLVANRFGVFSDDPEQGMQARAQNIELYYQQLLEEIDAVDRHFQAQHEALWLEEGFWTALKNRINAWHRHYLQLLSNLNSDNWRQDLRIYQTILKPRIEAMHHALETLKEHLGNQSAQDIKGLSQLASRLTQTIVALTVIGVLLIVGGYLYLYSRVLKPIAMTAHALRQEANGCEQVTIPTPKLKETRDLVEAFSEMRHQVNKRQQGLDHLAHHDPLTQLPNRVLFRDRLQHAKSIAQRNRQCLALLFLDLDNFKQINDTLGHRAGDELLLQVAKRLLAVTRPSDTVARFGGDEFAILLENIGSEARAKERARDILEALNQPIVVFDQEFHITGSIGIAAAPCNAPYSDDLVRDADTAMYEAKKHGKNGFYCYSTELFDRATSQLTLERELRKAIEQDELLFHYQPIVDAKTNALIELEALLRWQTSKKELRFPGEFMACLLNLKQEQVLHQKLLQSVNRLQDEFLDRHGIALHIALNMAPCTLRNPQRHRAFIQTLRESRHPELIGIEITEDTLLEDLSEAQTFLEELKSLGSPLSLDDFGTGQSSLSHLRFFPFDRIKIDKAFIANVPNNAEDTMLVTAIIQLAHNFGMKVVAEGVETEAQRQFLIEAQCDYLQGYLISKPLPPDKLFPALKQLGV